MSSTRFFSRTKTTRHEIENEMHGYDILWLERPGIHAHYATWSNSQSRLVHRSPEAAYYSTYLM